MKYRREIDGLRAVAVVPVILFHAGFSAFSGGYVGVDVFFVISGYLITSILLKDLAENRFSIWRFYERRARRILPALFLVIACCIPIAWIVFPPSEMKSFAGSILAVTGFSSNILFWRESGYFDIAAELKPLLHTWSLAVEEQFYIFFPIFLAVVWRFGMRPIVWMVALAAAASLVLAHWGAGRFPSATFYLLPTRAWELMLGSLAAFWLHRYPAPVSNRVNDVLAATGLAAILLAVFLYDKTTPFPSLYALLPTLGTVLIILFATAGTSTHALLGMKVPVTIGLLSYSLYLWHQPLFAFARNFHVKDGSVIFYALISLTCGLAVLSWRYVEIPCRKSAVSSSTVFGRSLASAAVLVAASTYIYASGGLEGRFANREIAGDYGHDDFHGHISARYQVCAPQEVADRALSWGGFLRCAQSGSGSPDVVLQGDSHAESLFIGLAENMREYNVAFYIQNGLPFLDNENFDAIFRALLENGKSQTVVISTYFGRLSDFRPGVEAFERKLRQVVRRLRDAGERVILVSDVPRFFDTPERCMFTNMITERLRRCTVARDRFEAEAGAHKRVLAGLAEQLSVPVLNYNDAFCSEDVCRMSRGGRLLYRDDNHLNIAGSQLVGARLADDILSFLERQ